MQRLPTVVMSPFPTSAVPNPRGHAPQAPVCVQAGAAARGRRCLCLISTAPSRSRLRGSALLLIVDRSSINGRSLRDLGMIVLTTYGDGRREVTHED